MWYSYIRIGGLLMAISTAVGCSAGSMGNGGSTASASAQGKGGIQQDFATDARQYRQHAAELREMARRRQLEADVLAQKENPDMERVQGKRELAKDLLEAADQFEAKARELQRNVPHGMVQ